jgi:prevent-host-death family protein
MIEVNIHEAKTHLSKYLGRVERGETVVLCRHNKPIAEIRPIRKRQSKRRTFGQCKGQFQLGPEFFEPLPAELMAYFSGERP